MFDKCKFEVAASRGQLIRGALDGEPAFVRQRKHYARLWRTRRGEGSSSLGLWEVEFGDTIAESGGRDIIDGVKAAEVADSTRIGKGFVREVEPAQNGDHNVGNVGFESGGSDDR